MKKATKNFLFGLVAFVMAFMGMSFGVQNCLISTYYAKKSVGWGCYQGKLDTVATGATDSFKLECDCAPTSIVFNQDIWKVAGSPTVTVACYVSNNGGQTYVTAPLTSYTAVPTSTVTPVTTGYLVSPNFGTNPYTNYLWVATVTGTTSTVTWKGSITLK